MNPWEQKLNDSGLLAAAQAVESQLDTYREAELSIEDRGYLERIRTVNELVLNIAQHADPKLINYSALQAIVPNLNNITSYLGSWDSGDSPTYLSTHALGQLDSILQQLPLLVAAMNVPEARAAITSLRRSAARQKTIVDEITRKIEEKGTLADTTIDEKIAEAKESIDSSLAVVDKKLEDITSESEEVAGQLDEVKTAANKLATEQTATFNTAETERTKEFTKLMTLKQGELESTLDKLAKQTDEKSDAINKAAEKNAKATEDAKNRAEKLLGIVSQDALISDYSKNAKREWWSSLIWQIVAALSILLAIIFAAILAHEATGEMVWQKLLARLVVVAAFGGLATYAAKQATEHRQAQRQSEHMSLQLSAVRPYLEDVTDKVQRDALLIKLADKFFSEKKTDHPTKKKGAKDKGEEFISANDLLSFIATIIKRP